MRDYRTYRNTSKDMFLWSEKKIFDNQLYMDGTESIVRNIQDKEDIHTTLVIHKTGTPLSDEFKQRRSVLCPSEINFKRGSYVNTVGDGRNFLVITELEDNTVYKYGQMIECNGTFKWQNKAGVIRELPCILEDKTSVYSDGLNKSLELFLQEDQVMITVPNCDEIRAIDIDKRIIFENKRVYKLLRIDDLSSRGLSILKFKADTFNPATDDIDLEIADKIPVVVESETPVEPPTPPVGMPVYQINLSSIAGYVYYGKTRDVSVEILKDGVAVLEPYTVTIDDPYLMTVQSQTDTSFTLLGNTYKEMGIATMTVSLTSDPTVFSTIKIQAKGELW